MYPIKIIIRSSGILKANDDILRILIEKMQLTNAARYSKNGIFANIDKIISSPIVIMDRIIDITIDWAILYIRKNFNFCFKKYAINSQISPTIPIVK